MNFKRLSAPLMALLLLFAAVSGAAAAATFDSETTTTTTTSDVSGTSNTVTFYPGNSSEALYVETDGATSSNASELTLELSPAEAGVDYVAYSNSSAETVNATNGHYAFNVSHDELAEIPRDYKGGTYNLTVANSSEVILETEITLETSSDSSQDAYLAVTDDAGSDGAAMSNLVADRLTLEAAESGLFGISSLSWGDSNETEIATWSGYTKVNGTSSDVVVQLKNSSTADAYGAAAEDYEDGDWIRGSTMFVNGVPHKVYLNEAPEDADGTTVVYSESADTLTVDLNGEEYENVSNLSLRSTGGDGYGFGELWSNFGAADALSGLLPF